MLDNQLYVLLTQLLTVQAPARSLANVEYEQRFQPTQQGRNTERTVYMHCVGYKAVGSASVTQVPNGATMKRTETQSMETTIQFSITQPPVLEVDQLTHGDVLKIIRATLQSQDAQSFLVANGASVLRVSTVRNMFVTNDQNRNEPNPTFDLVVKHNDVFIDGVPFVNTFSFEVHAVPNLA